jgi:hypothetical protein
MTDEQKTSLCEALLDDDYGVCEKGFYALLDQGLIPDDVVSRIRITDGRVYIK